MNKLLLFCCCLLFVSQSCKKEGCTDSTASNYSADADKNDGSCEYPISYSSSFTVKHTINGNSFLFDTINYLHPAGYNFSIETLKYFISNIVLYKSSGDSVYLDMIHYVDGENELSRTYHWNESIDNGTYTGASLIFGLNESKNITGAFNNPPESLMEWPVPMGGGYHYMKMEGKYDLSGTIKSYNTHTGGLMGIPYHVRAVMNFPFTISDNTIDMNLIMEITNWYQNPSLYDFEVYGPSIMGLPAAQEHLQNNGHDVFSIESVH